MFYIVKDARYLKTVALRPCTHHQDQSALNSEVVLILKP